MWRLLALLLCLTLLEQGSGALLRDSSRLQLRSRKSRLEEAFHKLRRSFEKAHPDFEKPQQLSTQTKSATPAPPVIGKPAPLAATVSNSSDEVLFTVFTDSIFYDTRLAGIIGTWGREISPDLFVAISDKKRQVPLGTQDMNLPGTRVEETKCPPHSHWEGACCKWAEGVIFAQEKMEQNPKLKWAFFSDDDVYLRPGAIASVLRTHEASPEKPLALGIFGCNTPGGCTGLCGGGGFAMNRAALQRLAGKDPVSFLNAEMSQCMKCDKWADQAISMVWADRGVEMQQLQGLNGWMMKEDQFINTLNNGDSLLFHYQRTKNQMEALHEIFTHERLLTEEKGPCIKFDSHTTCAASMRVEDTPFLAPQSLENPATPR